MAYPRPAKSKNNNNPRGGALHATIDYAEDSFDEFDMNNRAGAGPALGK